MKILKFLSILFILLIYSDYQLLCLIKSHNTSIVKNIEFGFKGLYFDYKEVAPDDIENFKSEESGFLPGIFASLRSSDFQKIFFTSKIELNFGNQQYEGAIQDSAFTPYSGNHNASYMLFDICINYQNQLEDSVTKLIPFLGFQYRSWNRDMSSLRYKGDPAGYQEIYRWCYLRIGAAVEFELSSNDFLNITGSVNLMFSGSMTAYLSKISSSAPDLNFILGNAPSTILELSYKHTFNKNWGFSITGFFDKYSFNKSDPIHVNDSQGNTYTFTEPSSNTNSYGFQIGISYKISK